VAEIAAGARERGAGVKLPGRRNGSS
jgi:hypothetical protein